MHEGFGGVGRVTRARATYDVGSCDIVEAFNAQSFAWPFLADSLLLLEFPFECEFGSGDVAVDDEADNDDPDDDDTFTDDNDELFSHSLGIFLR